MKTWEHELRKNRNALPWEWERQIWDAFMIPIRELGIPEEEQKQYAQKARIAAENICWDHYSRTRQSFRNHCVRLLREHGRNLSDKEQMAMKERMYVRFMEGRIATFQYREKEEACPIPPIPVGENDLHNVDMAMIFAHLPPQPETADFLESVNVDWHYDQLHMVTWFSCQLSLGSGRYSRRCPNHSAKKTYERLLNPYSLLWIAAALGEDQEVVWQAAYESRDYATYRAKCGVIRSIIPWKRICELALKTKAQQENNEH